LSIRFPKSRWVRLVIVSLLIGYALATAAAITVYQYGQPDHAAPADVIIVLGGGTQKDGSASPATVRRAQHAAALYHKGLAPYVLCTGTYTQQHPKTEAQACADVAEQNGVPASAIVMEERSASTEENAIETRKVMDERGFKTAVLVTDNFHVLRAEMLFKRQGIPVFVSPAEATTGTLDWWSAAFGSYREVGALAWYEVKTALGLPYTSTGF
jgi:uncharacterized SAM-binding protein YcdF (DUF218 family)